MTTFITQARFTKDGLKGMVASPEDRAEVVGRLIGEVGGKLISYYMTSGDYDVLPARQGRGERFPGPATHDDRVTDR